MPDDATVTAADIARLADVGRAAVSNWRRRYDDFPAPVGGTATSPTFSLAEVEGWLRGQGKLAELAPDERVWQHVRSLADDLRLPEVVGSVLAFLAYLERSRSGSRSLEGRTDADLVAHLPGEVSAVVSVGFAETFDASWVPMLRAVADLAAVDGARRVGEFLLARYMEVQSRRLTTTPAEVAELMVALADPPLGHVLDPACGHGTLLLAAASHADRLGGQELDVSAARIAEARIVLAAGPGDSRGADGARDTSRDTNRESGGGPEDLGARPTVRAGDSLRGDAFDGVLGDVVLCSPPFNERSWGYEELTGDPRWTYGLPPRGEAELAWVQHALAHVRPGGRVVMLMPAAAADRRSGRRIRSQLLRAGAVRAVVALPSGAAPSSAIAPHLWVMRRPEPDDPPPARLLLVDAFAGLDRAGVERIWRAFRDDPDDAVVERPGVSRAVPVIDLLDERVDLTPAHHLPRAARVRAADLKAAVGSLTALAAELPGLIPAVRTVDGPAPDGTSVAELVRSGGVEILQSISGMRTDTGTVPVLTLTDVRAGRGPTGRTPAGPRPVMVRAGDVVVSNVARTPAARVVGDERAALGPHLYLLRLDPERLDPYFVAGSLRASMTSQRASTTSGGQRLDVRRAMIPRLPLDGQRDYGAAFRDLERLGDRLHSTAAAGDALRELLLGGLAEGSLRPVERLGERSHGADR